jgi:hypothetical protein
LGAAVILLVCVAVTAQAQDEAASTAQPNGHRALDTVKFLTGAGAGLVLHEAGHLTFDLIFDADPRLEGVHFGPFPFFAVTHRSGLSPRREFTISSAGFWVQEATNEWLLNPRLCGAGLRACDGAWFKKGMLAFNVLNSLGYAVVAFARAGPVERDTRGMADSIDVDEPAIGALVLTPALLDAYRYYHPDARWAVWASRLVKAGSVLLVLKQTSSSRR